MRLRGPLLQTKYITTHVQWKVHIITIDVLEYLGEVIWDGTRHTDHPVSHTVSRTAGYVCRCNVLLFHFLFRAVSLNEHFV